MPLGMPGPPAAPLPPAPIAAALPTVTAGPSPFSPPAPSPFAPPSSAAANRPTLAISPPPPISADRLFGAEEAAQQWAAPHIDPHSMAAANEPTARPSELDPQILALMAGQPEPNPAMALDQSAVTPKGAMKTGMRRRSKLQVMIWILIGAAVIGGGVFAGFQIREMRLDKQIVAARKRATDLAKADMWKGWRDARDSLAGIVEASSTIPNQAALARVRALIAYELGD